MLRRFAVQLRARLPDTGLAEPNPDQLARDAHTTVSMAGMLGFDTLAAVCRQVEESATTRNDLRPLLKELRSARDAALAQIDALPQPKTALESTG